MKGRRWRKKKDRIRAGKIPSILQADMGGREAGRHGWEACERVGRYRRMKVLEDSDLSL